MNELYELIVVVLITSILYWNTPDKYRLLVLILSCSAYLIYEDYVSFLILIFLTLITFLLLKKSKSRSILIYITFLIPIALFIIIKWSSTYSYGAFNAALPLGMSYYLFRLIHFCIEVFKKNIVDFSLKDFIGYLFFLPVILIGPIIRFQDWKKEYKRNRWDTVLISNGLERMLYGSFKVVVLGNYLISTKLNESIPYIARLGTWLGNYLECFSYGANSYLLFAGYSDIAVGASMLFGIRIMENFNFPFLAPNINDFWNRWHISLSSWCRDYVFMPMVSYTRVYWLAILTSMLVLGLWHEFSLRYIAWAFFHVLGIVVWHIYSKYIGNRIVKNTFYELIAWFITFNFVVISFVFLKERDIEESLQILMIILGFK